MSRMILLTAVSFLMISMSCANKQNKIDDLAQDIYSKSKWDTPLPPNEFKSDGCSCWPDGDWFECCVKHDLVYWMGGTRYERKQADLDLKKCILQKGHPIIAQMMYFGVRIGGIWWLPTPFRWGFGWDYPQSGPPNKSY